MMKRIQAAMVAGVLSVSMSALPASAQNVVIGGGPLVNLQTGDILSDNTVEVLEDANVVIGVALQVAANVCDVNVNVLAEQLRTGEAYCQTDQDADGVRRFASIRR